MSDLHLEFWPYDEDRFIDNIVNKTPQSDLIILAGDIGVLAISYEYILSLLTKISVKGGTVVYVPGNHEFYKLSYEDGKSRLKNLRDEVPSNVVVCCEPYDNFAQLGYHIFYGTLWFPNLLPAWNIKQGLADFSQIKGLEPAIYKENDAFVKAMEVYCNNKTIVVTHHSPSYRSTAPKYVGSPLNQFFCNDLDSLIEEYEPKLICHGHLHDPVDYKIGKTRIISNPAGYPTEIDINWKPKTIVIDR